MVVLAEPNQMILRALNGPRDPVRWPPLVVMTLAGEKEEQTEPQPKRFTHFPSMTVVVWVYQGNFAQLF